MPPAPIAATVRTTTVEAAAMAGGGFVTMGRVWSGATRGAAAAAADVGASGAPALRCASTDPVPCRSGRNDDHAASHDNHDNRTC